MTRWRLGLDVGTASIGAVAVILDADGHEESVPWHTVRIFSEPNEKGKSGLTPKKAGRREARQQRRQIDRRRRRIRRVAHLAPLIGLAANRVPADGKKGTNLTAIRAKAARERIELDDFLRVMLRLAKRRGYSGGFKAADKDSDAGAVQTGSMLLQEELAALAEVRGVDHVTLGEFLASRIERGLPARLKLDEYDVANLYALRGMVEDEFDIIWETQSKFHDSLRRQSRGRPVKERFHDAIFYQRPLRSPAPMVGACPLEITLPRAARAQPAAQRFRIEKTLADLRWGSGRLAQPLTPSQRSAIRDVLNDPKKLTKSGTRPFSKLYQDLEKAGCPGPRGLQLNLHRMSREQLVGNKTSRVFEALGLYDSWMALSDAAQVSVVNLLADLGSPEQLDDENWSKKFLKANGRPGAEDSLRCFAPAVVDFVDKLRANDGYGRMTSMGFDGGRMAYSVKALNKLTNWLRDPAWDEEPRRDLLLDESVAIEQCYPSMLKNIGAGHNGLIAPPRTGNDVVDVALGQVYRSVSEAVESIGCAPSEIIIEFGREVGRGSKERNRRELENAKNQRARMKARDEIGEAGYTVSSTRVFRYQLWQEQGTHCPYCSSEITLDDAMDGGKSHIEHILPRSLTRVGRKRTEIVLSHRSCNDQKGDRTPWQAFGHDEARWRIVTARAEWFKKNKQYRKASLLLLKDFETEVLNDESIAEFVDRQLHQTSWVARVAAQWLSSLCPNVFAARGQFTAQLRRRWNLDTVIPQVRIEQGFAVLDTEGHAITAQEFQALRSAWEGHGPAPVRMPDKRLDHRHHVIDALVIALTSRGLYQKLARSFRDQLQEIRAGRDHRLDIKIEPPLQDVRNVALGVVRACNLVHKPDRFAGGRFFEDTAYGMARGRDGEGRRVLAKRIAVSQLADDRSVERSLKNIESIESDAVRDLVLGEFRRRVSSGATPRQALSVPVEFPKYRTAIRKVRVRTDKYADAAVSIEHASRNGKHRKWLLNDGFACLDLTRGENGKLESHLVTMAEAAANVGSPLPQGVTRIFKGDTVMDVKDGMFLVVRQIKSQANGLLTLVPIFETRPVRELKAADGLKKISGTGLKRLVPIDGSESHSAVGGSA